METEQISLNDIVTLAALTDAQFEKVMERFERLMDLVFKLAKKQAGFGSE